MRQGLAAYAINTYYAHAGLLDLDDYRTVQATGASLTGNRRSDLSTAAGYHAADDGWPRRALTDLAVEWLADHAGDPAVFDYYRRLPEATSRHEAFEQTFGLTHPRGVLRTVRGVP